MRNAVDDYLGIETVEGRFPENPPPLSVPKPKRKALLARIDRQEKRIAELESEVERLKAKQVDAYAQTRYEREAIVRITKALGLPAGWWALSPRQRDGMRINASQVVREKPRLETSKTTDG